MSIMKLWDENSEEWKSIPTLKGDPGPSGAQGPQGLRGLQGEQGPKGDTGNDGYTPVKGIDYFDGEQGPKGDKGDTGATGSDGADGVGIPIGGTEGQVLSKASNTNFDTDWVDLPDTGITVAQVNSLIDTKILSDNQAKYHIGKIIFDTENVNPATYLGFGTWVLWGAGRVPVGVDTTQTEFNAIGKTGGAKTHTLTIAQMPSHTHTQNAHTHTQNAHTHTQNAHSHQARAKGFTNITESSGGWLLIRRNQTGDSYDSTANNVAISATATNRNTTATNQNTTATNQNTGGGNAHNNLQPYITCYMWKRTA